MKPREKAEKVIMRPKVGVANGQYDALCGIAYALLDLADAIRESREPMHNPVNLDVDLDHVSEPPC